MKLNINEFVDVVMKDVEVIRENGLYCGSIPALPGVWAQAPSEPELLKELAATAKDWIQFRQQRGLDLPLYEGGHA